MKNFPNTVNLKKVTIVNLCCNGSYGTDNIEALLEYLFQNNKIVELELRIHKDPVKLARVVYSSINLVVLKLHANVKLELYHYNIIYPNVKVLYFIVKTQKDWDATIRLYNACPVLQELFLGNSTYLH